MIIAEAVAKEARKFAIKNAIDYGKARPGPVISKLLATHAELKQELGEVSKDVDLIVAQVNRLSREGLEKEYAKYRLEFEVREKEKAEESAKPKMVIEGAEMGKVVTRYPPEPGGYMQIGNAKQCILSAEFARIYKGKIHLYFDDTNPEKSTQEFVEATKEDTEWLGIRFDKEYFASDYVETIYGSGKRLLRQGDAYVCLCGAEEVKKNRAEKRECIHRSQDPEENLVLFEQMLVGKYDEGEAIVRLRGEMNSDNAAFRDPTLFRVKKEEHYRQRRKYEVWPTYHINTPVMDNLNGVTDVIRDKNYEIWDSVNKRLLQSLGLKIPRMHYQARLRIVGAATGKRVIRRLIKEGAVSGWDDPRLLTIRALRRRGVQPKAIWDFVLRFGMSRTDSTVGIEMLFDENKKLIDPIAKHLFFVKDPVKLTVMSAKPVDAALRLYSSNNSGVRGYTTGEAFYISHEDSRKLKKGDIFTLKDLYSVKVLSKGRSQIEVKPMPKLRKKNIIQWVSEGNYVPCSVLVPENLLDNKGKLRKESLKVWRGYVEDYATKLREREIVQFERVGYCILDDKEEGRFIFTS